MKPIIKIKNIKFLNKRFIGITLFPFIFIKKSYYNKASNYKKNKTICHESIHFKQQIEMLVLFFYSWYIIEYLIKLFKYKNNAYRNLSFEREAYSNDKIFIIKS